MEKMIEEFKNLSLKPDTCELFPPTGLVYHDSHLKHRSTILIEDSTQHVENPLRVTKALEYLKKTKVYDRCEILSEFQDIDFQHIENIHGKKYVSYIKNLFKEDFPGSKFQDNDTYYNKHSLEAALKACEGTRLCIDKIMKNEWKNGFALVRPPGHHACAQNEKIQGFCLINNVAVAAEYLTREHGLKKIAILDWDVHHGDST